MQDGAAAGRTVDPQIQPGDAGQAHLRPQPEQLAPAHLLDPPEVERFAGGQPVRVAADTAPADAADRPVHGAPDAPGDLGRIPAARAADAFDDPPQRRRQAATGQVRSSK